LSIGVQLRTGTADGAEYQIISNKLLDRAVLPCLERYVHHFQNSPSYGKNHTVQVFLTSDDQNVVSTVLDRLGSTTVLQIKGSYLHSAKSAMGLDKAFLDWWLLGECEHIFGTYPSSFVITAPQRQRHRTVFLFPRQWQDRNESNLLRHGSYIHVPTMCQALFTNKTIF